MRYTLPTASVICTAHHDTRPPSPDMCRTDVKTLWQPPEILGVSLSTPLRLAPWRRCGCLWRLERATWRSCGRDPAVHWPGVRPVRGRWSCIKPRSSAPHPPPLHFFFFSLSLALSPAGSSPRCNATVCRALASFRSLRGPLSRALCATLASARFSSPPQRPSLVSSRLFRPPIRPLLPLCRRPRWAL